MKVDYIIITNIFNKLNGNKKYFPTHNEMIRIFGISDAKSRKISNTMKNLG